jgi:hypothetical protein
MQMHLTLVGLLIVIGWVGYITNARDVHLDAERSSQIMLTIAMLVTAAVTLAVCAKLLWRRWMWVYLLILTAEAIVIVNIVRTFASGLAVGILVLLYAALTVWVLANVFRREVRVFLLRLRPLSSGRR